MKRETEIEIEMEMDGGRTGRKSRRQKGGLEEWKGSKGIREREREVRGNLG